MDKWTLIMLEMEDMWAMSAASRSMAARGLDSQHYARIRDEFKARRIYDLYGWEYFSKFVERCPHIQYILTEYLPCDREASAQCNMFCNFYKGGCTYANE